LEIVVDHRISSQIIVAFPHARPGTPDARPIMARPARTGPHPERELSQLAARGQTGDGSNRLALGSFWSFVIIVSSFRGYGGRPQVLVRAVRTPVPMVRFGPIQSNLVQFFHFHWLFRRFHFPGAPPSGPAWPAIHSQLASYVRFNHLLMLNKTNKVIFRQQKLCVFVRPECLPVPVAPGCPRGFHGARPLGRFNVQIDEGVKMLHCVRKSALGWSKAVIYLRSFCFRRLGQIRNRPGKPGRLQSASIRKIC